MYYGNTRNSEKKNIIYLDECFVDDEKKLFGNLFEGEIINTLKPRDLKTNFLQIIFRLKDYILAYAFK